MTALRPAHHRSTASPGPPQQTETRRCWRPSSSPGGHLDWHAFSVDSDAAAVGAVRPSTAVDGEIYVSSPKSARGRMIDLDRRTLDVLRRHFEQQQSRSEAFLNRDGGEGYVFRRRDGSRIDPRQLSEAFR